MDIALVFFIILGGFLTWLGGSILFSDKGLERMYAKGYWKIDKIFGESHGRQYDRYAGGGGLFIAGLILVIGSIIAFFI